MITRGKVKRSFYNDGFSPVLVAKHSPELRTWEAGLYVSEDLSNPGDAWLAPGSRRWKRFRLRGRITFDKSGFISANFNGM